MSRCVMGVSGDAPCQCSVSGGHQTTSPVLISAILPSRVPVSPAPEVTMMYCPAGWLCQDVLAPGWNEPWAPEYLAVPLGGNSRENRTSPVNNSLGPLNVFRRSPPKTVCCFMLLSGVFPEPKQEEEGKSINGVNVGVSFFMTLGLFLYSSAMNTLGVFAHGIGLLNSPGPFDKTCVPDAGG